MLLQDNCAYCWYFQCMRAYSFFWWQRLISCYLLIKQGGPLLGIVMALSYDACALLVNTAAPIHLCQQQSLLLLGSVHIAEPGSTPAGGVRSTSQPVVYGHPRPNLPVPIPVSVPQRGVSAAENVACLGRGAETIGKDQSVIDQIGADIVTKAFKMRIKGLDHVKNLLLMNMWMKYVSTWSKIVKALNPEHVVLMGCKYTQLAVACMKLWIKFSSLLVWFTKSYNLRKWVCGRG